MRSLLPEAFKQAQLAVKCVVNSATGTDMYVFDDPARYRRADGQIHGQLLDGSGRAAIGVPKLLVKLPYNVVCELKVPDLIATLLGWLGLTFATRQHLSQLLANSERLARLRGLMQMSEADVNRQPVPDYDKKLLNDWLRRAARAAAPLGGGIGALRRCGVQVALHDYFDMPGAHVDFVSIEVHVLEQPVKLRFTIQYAAQGLKPTTRERPTPAAYALRITLAQA